MHLLQRIKRVRPSVYGRPTGTGTTKNGAHRLQNHPFRCVLVSHSTLYGPRRPAAACRFPSHPPPPRVAPSSHRFHLACKSGALLTAGWPEISPPQASKPEQQWQQQPSPPVPRRGRSAWRSAGRSHPTTSAPRRPAPAGRGSPSVPRPAWRRRPPAGPGGSTSTSPGSPSRSARSSTAAPSAPR